MVSRPAGKGLRKPLFGRIRMPEKPRLPRSAIRGYRDEEATDAQTSQRHHHQQFPGDFGLGARAVGARRRVEASRVSATSGGGVQSGARRCAGYVAVAMTTLPTKEERVVLGNVEGRGFRPLVECLLNRKPREAKA